MEKWALAISVLSIILAAFSLGWNVYRDVLLKPRVKVSFAIMHFFEPAGKTTTKFLGLRVTNMGPGAVQLNAVYTKQFSLIRYILRKHTVGYITMPTTVDGGNLPKQLDVGDQTAISFPYESEFMAEDFTHIGVGDSFGRVHWAPKKDVITAREKYEVPVAENPTAMES